MTRPFVVCHMFVSMDGKIDGQFMSDPNAVPARTVYGKLRKFYNCAATIYGTTTMRAFADGLVPEDLPEAETELPREDYVAPHEGGQYVISVDPDGILGWDTPYYQRAGRPRAHVVEALTERVPSRYLAYLRRQGVSYVIAGKETLDCGLLLHKVHDLFAVERAMLAGGGHINGSFLQEDLIDEVSIVVAPVVDGNTESVSIFERSGFLPSRAPADFTLLSADRVAGDGLWLRYAPRRQASQCPA